MRLVPSFMLFALLASGFVCSCGGGAGATTEDAAPEAAGADVRGDERSGDAQAGDSRDLAAGFDLSQDSNQDSTALDLPPLPACGIDDDCAALAPEPCQVWTCGEAGQCELTPVEDGQACAGDDPCVQMWCQKGACVDHESNACDDGNPCTTDGCEPDTGCVHTNNDQACDDGNPCTLTDLCTEGACVGGGALECDDDNPCTEDFCAPLTGCTHKAIVAACDDGDPCTGSDTCVYGLCVGAVWICECFSDEDCLGIENPCATEFTCDLEQAPYLCKPTPESIVPCDDFSPCLAGTCDVELGQCVPAPKEDGLECVDLLGCVASGTCQQGVCTGEAVECEDPGLCQQAVCTPGDGCVVLPEAGPCDDQDGCSGNDWCVEGVCGGVDVCAETPSARYRLLDLTLQEPELWLLLPGGDKVPITASFNLALQDQGAGLGLVVELSPLDIYAQDTGVSLGVVQCAGEADCDQDDLQDVGPAFFCLEQPLCPDADYIAPGFQAGGSAVSLDLGLGAFVAQEVGISAGMKELPQVSALGPGQLQIFVVEEEAQKIILQIPMMQEMSLADLLASTEKELSQGVYGWSLRFSFSESPALP